MKSYNVKCLGCGNYLNDDINSVGYVFKFEENKTKYCKRCFQLKHYGKTIDNINYNNQIEDKLSSLNFENSYVCVILDVWKIETSLIKYDLIKNASKIYFVVNKIDCLPKKFNLDLTSNKINEIIHQHGFEEYTILYTSIKNNSSIKKLNNKLKDIPRNKKIFFIGKTNTGKSSLINKLLEINKKQPTLSTSPFMNTTLDLKKIKLDKLEIIDTPGFIDKTNILNFVDAKFSKSILTVNGVNSKNYYLSSNQSILIEKLAIFNYLVGDKNNFTFYLSKNLNLLRCKYEKALSNFNNENISAISYNSTMKLALITHKFTLNKYKKYNLYINGLVMISINAGAEEISVTLDKNIGVILSETAII